MPRVCFFTALLVFLSACTSAEVQPPAIADRIGNAIPGKGILACTGLPLGGQKCDVGLPGLSPAPPAQASDAPHG